MEEPEKKLFATNIRRHQGSQELPTNVHNCITMHGTKKKILNKLKINLYCVRLSRSGFLVINTMEWLP